MRSCGLRLAECRSIGQVKGLGAKLGGHSFVDREILEERQVHIAITRAVHLVAIFFHDFVQEGQPIYRLTIANGHLERIAGMRDARSADVVDYRFAGLAPGDIPLVNARMSTANIYSAAIRQQ